MATETASSLSQVLGMVLPLVLLFAVFYFLIIRPQKKRDKETRDMLSALKKGDKITTIGGIVGTVVDVKEDKFVIETGADQVRIELAKWALSTNETADAAAKEQAKKDAEAMAKAKAVKKAEKN